MPTVLQTRSKSIAWIACVMTLPLLWFDVSVYADNNASDQRTFSESRTLGIERSKLRNLEVPAVAETPKQHLAEFKTSIKPILHSTCTQCHGEETREGNVRIDTLDPDLVHGNDIDWWLEVQSVLSNGEMPPPDEAELSDNDRAKIIEWLSREFQVASVLRRESREASSLRRMTRYEFNYALQDLLGLSYDFAKDLPPEAHSEDGFQNSSTLLQMSVSQLETFQRLAREALLRSTVRGDRPAVLHWGLTMEDVGRIDWQKHHAEFEKAKSEIPDDVEDQTQRLTEIEKRFHNPHPAPYYKNLTTGRTTRATWRYSQAKYANQPTESPRAVPEQLDHVAILPRSGGQRLTIELGNRIPDDGTMRVRVRASRASADDEGFPSLQLLFGWQASNEGRALMPVPDSEQVIAAEPDQPEFYQWDVPLGEIYPRNSVRDTSEMGQMPNPSEYIAFVNNSVSQGAIKIDYVEVAAPVFDQWPPESHQRIFLGGQYPDDERSEARKILTSFMERAWRRSIRNDEIDQKLRLFEAIRPTCDRFEETMIEVLSTVLASPQFLYVTTEADDSQNLSAHELACRLSMFLWCSIPDAELRQLSTSGELLDPDVLRGQVQRMLADDRAKRFSTHFVHQWLDMQLLEFRAVSRDLESLKAAMQREPVALFDEMIRTDASVLDFLHADYTMANERLAVHYGLSDVKGNHFRRVALQPEQRRGGLLTQAGLLTMNSAGDDSHPLKRSVWLLESLLNDPPPPPPPAVPEIDLADPEIAKMTLKEQMEVHRSQAACMSCHAKIDPWGIAFENYDSLGRWRNQIDGKPVDATSQLPNKQSLNGMDGLKRFLLEDRQDQFVRALVHKLTTYALGRPLVIADYALVEEIASEVRQHGDGLATMIELIVMSDLFRME